VIPDRPDRVPDAIEPLMGYRAWHVSGAFAPPDQPSGSSDDDVTLGGGEPSLGFRHLLFGDPRAGD